MCLPDQWDKRTNAPTASLKGKCRKTHSCPSNSHDELHPLHCVLHLTDVPQQIAIIKTRRKKPVQISLLGIAEKWKQFPRAEGGNDLCSLPTTLLLSNTHSFHMSL